MAYLAVIGRSQQRERLCELFWEVPDDPRGALRWSLSKIRKVLGSGAQNCLAADRNTVMLKLEGIDLDFACVRTLIRDDPGSLQTSALEELAVLLHGGFLSDLSLPRCPDFEAWRVAMANDLELARVRVLQELIRRFRDAPERALAYAHALQSVASNHAEVAKQVEALSHAARQGALQLIPAAAPQVGAAAGAGQGTRPGEQAETPAPARPMHHIYRLAEKARQLFGHEARGGIARSASRRS